MLVEVLVFLLLLAGMAVSATACEGVGGPELTTLSTKLAGEGKEGETITVLEGSKVKDKATLKGKNASSATGKVTYKVYSDSECKTLYKEAGEVTVSGESVSASSEEELEGGASYYWRAHYSGDSKNAESTSECTEISTVKAKTSLTTKLSGEGKEGEELTVFENSKVKDTATLSGTKSSTAGGKVVYKIYSDKECKTLVKEAGEVTVSSGSVPASSEEELEGGKTYYWQATYKGDTLHQESKSECGKEVLNVKDLEPVYFASPTGEYPYGVSITGTKMTILEAGKDSVTCGKVEFTGELTKTSETQTLTPNYSECEGDIEGTKSSATVSPGTCKLEFSSLSEGPEIEGEIKEMTGKESIGPSPCGAIKIEVPSSSCTFEVLAQGPAKGATLKPSGEEIETTSALEEANLEYTKGCEPKEKLIPHTFYLLLHGVVHEIIEFIGAHLTLWYGGAQITSLTFPNENEEREVEIRNPNHFLLYYRTSRYTGASSNWRLTSIAGQPGLGCIGVVFLHNGTCRYGIISPRERPATITYYFEGYIYNRAELTVKVG
jgi:uncharacterized protein YacL (UPF0231 family)